MTSKLLDAKLEPGVDPLKFLQRLYQQVQPKFRFDAGDADAARRWQQQCRAAVAEAVGFQDLPCQVLGVETIEEVDRGDHVRRKLLLQLPLGAKLPVYLLSPRQGAVPLPVVLAFHGHGYGVKDIVGLWEDGQERYAPDGYHKDFAIELCRKGLLVAAPEIMCFGEHQPDFSYLEGPLDQPRPTACHIITTYAMMLGGSAVGLRVWQARCLVEYLQDLPQADTTRLGAMGISGGGMHTFFSTCLDTRIKACVISGYFCSWLKSILAMNHCTCNFVPDLLQLGDLPDLAGLLAPRPVLIEAGTRDPIFPIDAVREAFGKLKDIYALWDATGQVELDQFEGRHQISGARSYDFLAEKLA